MFSLTLGAQGTYPDIICGLSVSQIRHMQFRSMLSTIRLYQVLIFPYQLLIYYYSSTNHHFLPLSLYYHLILFLYIHSLFLKVFLMFSIYLKPLKILLYQTKIQCLYNCL